MTTNVTVSHVDTCLSCYLTDHHTRDGEALYGHPVNKTITYADILASLNHDLPMFDCIDYVVSDDMLKAAIADCFASVSDMSKVFDATLDAPSDDECGEVCQAWFLITWESDEGTN